MLRKKKIIKCTDFSVLLFTKDDPGPYLSSIQGEKLIRTGPRLSKRGVFGPTMICRISSYVQVETDRTKHLVNRYCSQGTHILSQPIPSKNKTDMVGDQVRIKQ